MNYYIFGAHSRGYTLFEYLRSLRPQDSCIGFLYDNDEINPTEIEGVIVTHLANNDWALDTSAEVYIATRGVYHDRITNALKSTGFRSIIRVTPEFDTDLRNRYVKKYFEDSKRIFTKISEFGSSINKINEVTYEPCLYVVKTLFDGAFKQPVRLKDYEKIIQAGCDLSDNKLEEASFFDNFGDSISDRNAQFCELTALYWLWKHAEDDIIGLEHWRRRFILPSNWHEIMQGEGIDVILPVPLCVMPSLSANYKSRHVPHVWDKCMEILKKHHPEDCDNALCFFEENKLYSPCNMMIARREILKEYCEWLFPVLIELNDLVGNLDDNYQNRYPGFLAERLQNFFFDKNRERFKIAYADKSFLS